VQAEFLLLSPFCHCNFRSHFSSLASFSGDAKQLYRVEDGPVLRASFSPSLLLLVTPCAFQHFLVVCLCDRKTQGWEIKSGEYMRDLLIY